MSISEPGPEVDLIEHAAKIIIESKKQPHTAPYHWAGALREAGMLVPPGHAAEEQARAETADPTRYWWLEGRLMSLRRLRHWAGTHQPDNTALLDRIDQQTTLAENDLRALDGDQDGTP